jgi:hypothetical protein
VALERHRHADRRTEQGTGGRRQARAVAEGHQPMIADAALIR